MPTQEEAIELLRNCTGSPYLIDVRLFQFMELHEVVLLSYLYQRGGVQSTHDVIKQNTGLSESQQAIAIRKLRDKGYISLDSLSVKSEKVKEAVRRTA